MVGGLVGSGDGRTVQACGVSAAVVSGWSDKIMSTQCGEITDDAITPV
jgi:hypothetical protein